MLLTSWKSISKHCDNCSITTLKRWIKKHDMPIKWVGKKPTTTEEAIMQWWNNLPTHLP